MEVHRIRSASGRSTGREVEEWKMARDWMLKVDILLPSKAADINSTLFDFAQSLRDGVLLCQLANALEPGAVKDINTKSQMSQFMCLKNIRSFLMACTQNFCITNDDLFDAIGLYDVSDFAKVVHTLSKLSNTPQALSRKVEPFAPSHLAHDNVEMHEEEDIYSNLEEIALRRDITDEENPYDSVNIEEDDKIYEDLLSIQNIPKPTRQSSQEEKRKYVISELLETEKGYVEALRMIVMTFIYNPKLKVMLHPHDKGIIFINIEELQTIHVKFLARLERACNNEVGANIGKVFIDAKDDFLKYGNYCARMPDAQTHIDELSRRDAKIKDTLEDCQRRAKSKFSLRSLLVVPFQRVLKYPLLIQHLLKETKGNHPDKAMLEKAQECIQDVATFINQVKRDDENQKTVRDIQNSLTSEVGEDLEKFGRLMKDGEVQVKIGDRPPKKRHAFLFDRALIICKHKGDTYHHKATLFLDYFELQENYTFGPGRGKFLHGWSMKGETPESERNSCSLYAKTLDMKDKWVNEIKRAMDNLKLPGIDQRKHKFDLYTFGNATYCSICQKLLWGLIHQGYKCSRCDTACHKDCITKCNPCRKNTQDKQFSGISPFQPMRPGMGKGAISGGQTLSPEPERRPRKISAPPRIGVAANDIVIATSNFQGMAPGGRPSLNLAVGDEVEVMNQSDPEWWEGRSSRTGSVGYFLRSHVAEKEENTDRNRRKSQRSSKRGHKYEEHTLMEETPENISAAPEDMNAELLQYAWFVGKMDRATAERELSQRSDGTFLVRESVNREGEYALSVRFRVSTKHIKIPYDGSFCLTQAKVFTSITELIQYYRDNTLGVSFPGLDTTLRCGINEELEQEGLGWAKALYPYTARNSKEISIQKNSKILILNKDGDWWKGECDGQVGYFPSNYVEEIKE
ncbi:protein vav-like isoform X2 [Actinia tenebrosa]|uniref:Protein vav-like isoform X2 n=1 Tax=Actinia tenebrosa TaxID=6105 RepID=A0A6P8I6X2_ACTTE|nr:protein vav-like isoform X2 [Actinia tenebrosa]